MATWTDCARRVEALGYSTILHPDTLSTPSPIPMLAAATAVTTTLRVGTWVLCDPLRTIKGILGGQEDGLPRASQQPHPPILIAASGPKLLALAAREADIVAFGLAPDTTEDAAEQRIRVVRDAAGDHFDDLELAAGLIAIGEGEYPWLRRLGTDVQTLADNGRSPCSPELVVKWLTP